MIDPSVPIGPDDTYNVEAQRFGCLLYTSNTALCRRTAGPSTSTPRAFWKRSAAACTRRICAPPMWPAATPLWWWDSRLWARYMPTRDVYKRQGDGQPLGNALHNTHQYRVEDLEKRNKSLRQHPVGCVVFSKAVPVYLSLIHICFAGLPAGSLRRGCRQQSRIQHCTRLGQRIRFRQQ